MFRLKMDLGELKPGALFKLNENGWYSHAGDPDSCPAFMGEDISTSPEWFEDVTDHAVFGPATHPGWNQEAMPKEGKILRLEQYRVLGRFRNSPDEG